MCKRIGAFLLVVWMACSIISCGSSNTEPDKSLKDAVVTSAGAEVTYQGIAYIYHSEGILRVTDVYATANEGDVLVGWDDSPELKYYSYSTEAPMFLYETEYRNTYLRSDYDYRHSKFTIEGTETEIVFLNMFEDFSNRIQDDTDHVRGPLVTLYSNDCWRVHIDAEIILCGGEYYISPRYCRYNWKASDSFVNILKRQELLPDQKEP